MTTQSSDAAKELLTIKRALKWARTYEEVHAVFGDDVVGNAEKSLEILFSLATQVDENKDARDAAVRKAAMEEAGQVMHDLAKALANAISQMTITTVEGDDEKDNQPAINYAMRKLTAYRAFIDQSAAATQVSVAQYTSPWAVNDLTQPEVFRKVMLNINEDAAEALIDQPVAATQVNDDKDAEIKRLREALERLGSNEGFTGAFALDDSMASEELKARMDYATRSLKEKT